jgi:hypothetical protein
MNGDAGGISVARSGSSKSETTSSAFNGLRSPSLLRIVTTQAQIRAGIASSGICRSPGGK